MYPFYNKCDLNECLSIQDYWITFLIIHNSMRNKILRNSIKIVTKISINPITAFISNTKRIKYLIRRHFDTDNVTVNNIQICVYYILISIHFHFPLLLAFVSSSF